MADVKRQREELVSVLALLCGQPASNFVIAEKPLLDHLPNVPAGLPASLLERRPDIAKAERMVAARSADIGAEIANYFPAVRLTGEAGFLSKDVGNLFSVDTRVWSIGPSVSLPITSFFVTKAKVNRAKAKHEEAIAQYRGALLAAIKDVETSLTQIHFRKEQSEAQTDAVSTANRASELVRDRYEGGAVSYLELLDAERTSLSIERQAAQVKAQRMIATVRLIKALGGKW
jgi:multidrug efflux system outer membrane protein